MGIDLDRPWAQAVCDVCDPIFAAANVGFVRQVHEDPDQGITSLLWEANPPLFAARYPDSGIIESYGDKWPEVHCIDFWVYIDSDLKLARTSTEGWDFCERCLR